MSSSEVNADVLGQKARDHAMTLLHSYFTSQYNPLTRHHIDSYDQFLSTDLQTILLAASPILNVKEEFSDGSYKYTCKIFLGGVDPEDEKQTGVKQPIGIYIGTPTVVLENGKTVRAMFPNEARMRNLTYGIQVEMDILIKITLKASPGSDPVSLDPIVLPRVPLFTLPLMLHSRFCVLHGKPMALLQQMGECPQDEGGYFIVDGSEKILITSQEGAFNTLYIQEQKRDPDIQYYASILSLDPETRYTRRVSFNWTREKNKLNKKKGSIFHPSVLEISLPGVLKPIPLFVLFRALGIQSDQEILKLIFGDLTSPEAQYLAELLVPSMTQAAPLFDTWTALEYIRLLTKGFGQEHVLDVLHNQMFPHVPDLPLARATFLGYCVRRILRVIRKIDAPPSKDDTRNQRLLTSGFLVQMEFQRIFKRWTDSVNREISKLYNYNKASYQDEKFAEIFAAGNQRHIFQLGFITKELMKSFKGKWQGTSRGEGDSGFLQALSRLSYLDFMSHCRRVILNFDTSMKLTGPRFLNTSQYGYFCTCETPSGASIGVTKNFSMFTRVSTNAPTTALLAWLYSRGTVYPCEAITPSIAALTVPVFVNGGLIGYTGNPTALSRVLRLLKRTACLPPLSSSHFDIPTRTLLIYMDEGRPLRPLLLCEPKGALPRFSAIQASWTQMVIGSLPLTQSFEIASPAFVDPLADKGVVTLESYIEALEPHQGIIEYVDPYEQNQTLIANYPENIQPETTHMEIHPSTIMGLLGNMIPYPNHNQSPRNQLSASQSKQGVSLYASNFKNRFDNSAHILCYGEAPLSRTIYQDYVGNGLMPYGQNIILAMGMYSGYNQEDGIIMNADALARGQFRSIYYKCYEAFEENDPQARTQTRIANPRTIPGWLELKAEVDYSKLDEQGIVKVGEFVDQNTVIVGRYLMTEKGAMRDASVTAQVWTSGRVESVSVMVSNAGMRLVKIRVTQDRIPVLGDKFCLTGDHDVLTTRGWVPIADVTTNDKVAQLNREKDCLEYVHPLETYKFEHTGDMYEVKTQGVNLCVTLNHRMYIQTRNSTKYELIEANNMMGKRVRFSSYSPVKKDEYLHQIHSSSEVFTSERMNWFITLTGIWIAEGWTYVCEKDSIARLEISANKPHVYETLKDVCEALSLKYSYNPKSGKMFINNKVYATYFKTYSVGAINKRLPSWCFELNQTQSQLLLSALCMGDGRETDTSLHYGTSSIGLRDDIQILVQHAGYTSTYRKLQEKGTTVPGAKGITFNVNADHWGIYIRRKRLYPTLNHGHAKTQSGQSETIIQFSGNVYCLSVPSEVFLVRRKGDIVWTGNSNRHGQKGTANIFLRGHDMPRTADGIVPDMIMNPTAIPSRMTIGQIHEMMGGHMASILGAVTNATAFMNEGSPHELFGQVLEANGFNKLGNHVLYNGTTGEQIEAEIFMGVVYGMRLKHMTEDKWNARGEGRKEQRTHQPTGGRGNEGGLKIGEMERDAILAHGTSSFLQESMMARSDGTNFWFCNGCGTIPLYNEGSHFFLCPLCDGPIQFTGTTVHDLEPLPAPTRSSVSFSRVQMPYASALFFQELNTFLTMGLRVLTTRDTTRLRGMDSVEQLVEAEAANLNQKLPERRFIQNLPSEAELPEIPGSAAQQPAIESEKQLEQILGEFEASVQNEALPGTTQEIRAQAAAEQYAAQVEAAERAKAIERDPTLAPIPGVLGLPENTGVKQEEGEGPVISIDTSREALAPIAQQANQIVNNKPRRSRSPFRSGATTSSAATSGVPNGAVNDEATYGRYADSPIYGPPPEKNESPPFVGTYPLVPEGQPLFPVRNPNEESPPYMGEGPVIPDLAQDVVVQQGSPAAAAASEAPLSSGGRVNVVKLG